jgi:hypothetical protein
MLDGAHFAARPPVQDLERARAFYPQMAWEVDERRAAPSSGHDKRSERTYALSSRRSPNGATVAELGSSQRLDPCSDTAPHQPARPMKPMMSSRGERDGSR